jgi:hypothetical protein
VTADDVIQNTPLSPSQEGRLRRLCERADSPELVTELHAFIEDYARERLPQLDAKAGFADLLRALPRRAEPEGGGNPKGIDLLIQEHDVQREAAEAGASLDPEEYLAARYNFLRCCALLGIESPALEGLTRRLAQWTERAAPPGGGTERRRLQDEILDAQSANERLLARSAQWARDKQRLAELEGEALRLRGEAERERARGEAGKTRAAAVDADLAESARERAGLSERLKEFRDLDLYARNVKRFSLYTRTRMDYERGVMHLTAEQQEAADGARPGHDFLIRGGAGTGKTIVLLHALDTIMRTAGSELPLLPGRRILFLTYTGTLVKYDRYIAEILREADAGRLIMTADSFFHDRLRLLGRQQRVDYSAAQRLSVKLNTTGFFSAPELAVEVEDFIFANLVTRREYVEERIPRTGMKQPLSAGQREAVWNVREKMAAAMEHDGILSRNYSRQVIIDHLAAHPADPGLADLDFVFVDESQDLTAADLRALKLMSLRGLIMAGDTGQTIYGAASPYRRAGVDISGRTRVLHTSFRSTLPIQEVADAYRALSRLEGDEGTAAAAFRDGPAPELYTAGTPVDLLHLLLMKTGLFIDALGYDPENIAILAPTKTHLATIGDALGHAGYRWANIRDEEFSFKEAGTIRLSTLHSSKGLDFAVVLLFLPVLPPRGELDERAGQGIVRNLIYVAMTRAMDNLNVFTLEGAHDGLQEEPLQDLVRVFRQFQRGRLSSPPG